MLASSSSQRIPFCQKLSTPAPSHLDGESFSFQKCVLCQIAINFYDTCTLTCTTFVRLGEERCCCLQPPYGSISSFDRQPAQPDSRCKPFKSGREKQQNKLTNLKQPAQKDNPILMVEKKHTHTRCLPPFQLFVSFACR